MADKTDNIKTKLAFDGEAEYKAACKELNSNLKLLGSEMKLVTAEYKNNATSTEALKAKQDVLKRTYDEQAKKVEETEKALKAMKEAQGENSDGAKRLETALNQQKTALANTKNALDDTDKALNEAEKGADEFGKGIKESGKQADEAKGKFSNLGSVVGTVAKGLAAAVAGIAAAAVGAGTAIYNMASETAAAGDKIDKASQKLGISAELYQKLDYACGLSGTSIDNLSKGVKNITNDLADAQNGVKGASDAYEALGVSLKNTDGTFKSSETVLTETLAALADMTDETRRNAAANDIFGKSYQELQPLLNSGSEGIAAMMNEAEAYGMVMSNDAVKASAAWEDSLSKLQGTMGGVKNRITSDLLPGMTQFMIGLSDLMAGQDGAAEELQAGVTSMVESIKGMIPGLVEIVGTMATAIMKAAPAIIQSLGSGIINTLPELLPAATGIITNICEMILQLLPQLADAAVEIVLGLAQGIADALPELVPQIVDLMLYIVDTLVQNIPEIITAASDIIVGLAQGLVDALPMLAERLPEIIVTIINGVTSSLPQVIACAGDIIVALATGLVSALPVLIENLPQIVIAIVEGLAQAIPQVGAVMVELTQKVWEVLKDLPSKIWDAIVGAVTKMAEWGAKMQEKAKSAITSVCTNIVNGFKELPGKLADIGTNIVQGLWNGINNAKDWVLDKIKGFGDAVLSGLKSFFGIASPSKVMRDQVGVFLAQGIGEGFTNEMEKVSQDINNSIPREFDVQSKVNIDAESDYNPKTSKASTGTAGGVTVIQNIYAKDTSYKAQQKEAAKQFKDIAREVVA